MTEPDDWPLRQAEELIFLRANLHYGPNTARVPVPPEVEIEVLDPPDDDGGIQHVRVGDRFGATVNHVDEDGVRRVVFTDQGPYVPRADRPAEARVPYDQEMVDDQRETFGIELVTPTVEEVPITDAEYAAWLHDQEHGARVRQIALMRAIHINEAKDRHPHMDMRFWLANEDPTPKPVLTIRCAATRGSRSSCRKLLARVWQSPFGLYGVARFAPSEESTRLIAVAEYEKDYIRRLAEGEEYEFAPEYFQIPEIGIVMACRSHGNGTVPPEVIIAAADDRKCDELMIDPLAGQSRIEWR